MYPAYHVTQPKGERSSGRLNRITQPCRSSDSATSSGVQSSSNCMELAARIGHGTEAEVNVYLRLSHTAYLEFGTQPIGQCVSPSKGRRDCAARVESANQQSSCYPAKGGPISRVL